MRSIHRDRLPGMCDQPFGGIARLALAIAMVALVPGLAAQPIRRDEYLRHLPRTPHIVGQTNASALLQLYGDTAGPGYSDVAPMDGIDDRRGAHLLAIAERFSPMLRRNNFLVPRDVWAILGERPMLKIDTWVDDQRVRADSIVIAPVMRIADAGAMGAVNPPEPEVAADAKLAAIIREFDPERLVPAVAPPHGEAVKVLFFDLPGKSERSWRSVWERRGSSDSRIYAHFLIHEEVGAQDDRRFRLVVQYLFFYPFNDSGNNHEGDWEHINVHVATRASLTDTSATLSRAGDATAGELAALLDDRIPLDSLVIAAVDYFFHNHMLRVDYRTAQRPDHDERPGPVPASVSPLAEDHDYIRSVVDRRVHAFGGRLATHAIGYIGGNNKGPDELFHILPRFFDSYNRNSGATYPFPGTWQTIGPFGATETVWGATVPTPEPDTVPPASGARPRPDPDRDHWLTYRQADIELLPDWERLLPLIRSDASVRQRWSWMVLPIRWGYPATRSPGAGAVAYTDMGNVAPVGPAFKSWWNRVGPDREHVEFELRALWTPVSPNVPWSVVQSGWGILNYPLVISHIHPFYNVAGAHILPWILPVGRKVGVDVPRTFVGAESGRIATIGGGLMQSFGGDDYARTLRLASGNPDLASDGVRLDAERASLRATSWPRISLDLHMGRSLFLENSFSAGNAIVRYSGTSPATGSVALDGKLEMRQFTGGLRSPVPLFSTRTSRTFARLGYGWTWFTIRDVQLNDARVTGSRRAGYGPPLLTGRNSWPNLAYTGLTFEYFAPRRPWLPNRLGYGVRIESSVMLQRLPSHEGMSKHDLWMRRGDIAVTAIVGW